MTFVKNDEYFFLLLCCVMSKRNYIKADAVFWLLTVLYLVQEYLQLIQDLVTVLYVVQEELILIQLLACYCAIPCLRGIKADRITVSYVVQEELMLMQYLGLLLCCALSKRK